MTRMLDLRDVLELVIDTLDNGPFAQQRLVRQREQAVVHVGLEFGDELQAASEKLLEEGMRAVAFVAKQLAEEVFGELVHRFTVIDAGWCDTTGQQLTAIIDDDMQLEAKEPAYRTASTRGQQLKHPMLVDPAIMTDPDGRRIDETDPGTLTITLVQIGT